MKYPLCSIDEIPQEGSKILPFFGREVHVFWANGKPRAIANACTHIGGSLECKEGKFVCQWHGAEFDMTDGLRLKAPAPFNSRLMFIPTRVEDGILTYVWAE